MTAILILAFIVAPIIEIYVLLQAGEAFGVLPVIAACIATAIIGGALIRFQGLQARAAAQRDLAAGKPPVDSAVDGALLAIAAPFLMTPGFVTDALGFLLLTPPVRRAIARRAIRWIRRKIDERNGVITIRRP